MNKYSKYIFFLNRQDAGKKLIIPLKQYKDSDEAIILALPRGGVVVAYEVAKALNLPLDLVVSRKIGAPDNPEFAVGAIAEDGKRFFNQEVINTYGITKKYIDLEVEKEKKEAARRLKIYRGKTPLWLKDKIVILIDDGIATGFSMQAAVHSVKIKNAKKIVVAVPVVAQDSLKQIQQEVDEVIYLDAPLFFGAVSAFYKEFDQITDEKVIKCLSFRC